MFFIAEISAEFLVTDHFHCLLLVGCRQKSYVLERYQVFDNLEGEEIILFDMLHHFG